MPKAKYRVLDQLKELVHDSQKVTTQMVAEAAGLSRGVTSSYLSKLYHEGLIIKSGTKPVYWQLAGGGDAFSAMIGADGSLKKIVEECKSAVDYPPYGFPLIITGPSGVGKSYLASLIFKYAKEKGVISKDANFTVLNCADYANNPELLSSVLFGYKKGAFTGANADMPGLVDQADGGYLFLDEVHRLPRESQEKLFVLLDSGDFYPLGENKERHHVQVRFIFATTENLDNNLLQTFQRRVPLQVELTAISKRPLLEQCQLIEHFFKREALEMQHDIRVSYSTVKELLNTKQIGNVGSLANQIKLLCAEAFSNNSGLDLLEITLPGKNDNNIEEGYWLIKGSGAEKLITGNTDELYSSLSTLLSTLQSQERQQSKINEQSLTLTRFLRDTRRTSASLILDDYFTDYIQRKIEHALQMISARYGVLQEISERKINRAAEMISLLQKATELPDAKDAVILSEKHFPRTIYLCQKTMNLADIQVNQEWFELVLLYVIFGNEANKIEGQNLLAIMVCHGGGMASSICSVVNDLCGNYIFEAFDMPIDVSNREISQQINNYIKKQGRGYAGTILLFDMGSLSNMYREVKSLLDTDLLVINNLTTAIALDIGLQIQQKQEFKKIAEKAEKYPNTMNVQYYEGISQQQNIIVSCMSGVGLSKEVKEILQACLQSEVELITMDYRDLKATLQNHDHSYFKNTRFVLTTADVPDQNVAEVINIYDIMDKNGDLKLRSLLEQMGENKRTINDLMDELLRFFTIGGIKGRLRFMNPEIVIPEVQEIVAKFEGYYHLDLSGKIKLNLYMHIALMFERMLLNNDRSFEQLNTKEMSATEEEFYSVARNIFHSAESRYNIKVDDYELSLMYELFKPMLLK
ncbi:MAG TPA: sigma 54-interacting transcriptional regulator [Ligilactobacillus acidipiscis]|uniref:DNA translocase FtsK n=2 Tax=Ligilactobacillus acidipiscis TaxID=89059 RepID=A0A921F853_9LACO|nr:sigma 54-interacting transcriptional regulator [Ligilactobacillus acidipiscis]